MKRTAKADAIVHQQMPDGSFSTKNSISRPVRIDLYHECVDALNGIRDLLAMGCEENPRIVSPFHLATLIRLTLNDENMCALDGIYDLLSRCEANLSVDKPAELAALLQLVIENLISAELDAS